MGIHAAHPRTKGVILDGWARVQPSGMPPDPGMAATETQRMDYNYFNLNTIAGYAAAVERHGERFVQMAIHAGIGIRLRDCTCWIQA